ncbi:hypothetical protein OSB04_015911 [Centaurea solstitialis]|uniref:TIR domain-containing protein n=1 Tax=Centaurea solstitialis TaxID=347529 RepID=A0AA38TD78_9ASTR|nr:hypothetical protein OSB04_015911 [Centaurea solstitialis]
MASSSTSSVVHKSFKYDVFLSFRGEDTRNTFVGHLYNALQHKGIHTYKDNKRIQKGKRISDELIKSIQDSRFHIIVFSKNYASSSWCLEELVKIIECQKTAEQTAYPIFFDVEPSEVRKQNGEFGQVFAKHEKEEAVGRWRKALEEAANLAGWELKNTVDGHEAKFIQKVVEEISLELRSINFSVDEKLIGMEARIRDVVSSLELGVDDVRMMGIKGMGGGGKTTLAKAVFDHISYRFEGSSFVENIRENSNPNFSGLKKLQKQVLRDVLNDQSIKISNVHDGKKTMKKMMCFRKVLVVLDDVDHIEQLKALAEELNWFNGGSRIIITTRDEQVLVAHRTSLIRDVNLLSHEEAICLFSRHAFGRQSPIQDYKELSEQVVGYAAGLPLTITVLGSFFCGKDELEWKDAIERLKTIPLKETLEKLELSYIGLEEDYKEIFLDVACIMKGWTKAEAIRVLESCGFHARNGLRVLEQKSLITISKYGRLNMHDRIEEMGKYIVRRKLEEPNKHSRLWIEEEIKDVLVSNQGTNEIIRCIKLITCELDPQIVMEGLENMKKLRFLQVHHEGVHRTYSNWKFDEVCPYFPNALRCLRWTWFPFGSLPKSFQANNLVELKMDHSKIVQLWKGRDKKVLNKLRFLNLNYSDIKNLDLGLTPNLETLSLDGCHGLVELHIPLECSNLKSLDLNYAKLTTLDLRRTPNLERLSLVKCVDLVQLHMAIECSKLKSLDLSHTKLTTLDLRWTSNLERLSLVKCVDLVQLHMAVEFPKLKSLELSHTKLTTLDLRLTSNLEALTLVECDDLVQLHIAVECLKLKFIDINCSKLRTLDIRGTLNLETLNVFKCVDLVELDIPVECLKLESILINASKLRTLDLRETPNLKRLSIVKCVDLVELYNPFECLKLESIYIDGSKLRKLDLRGTPNLIMLRVTECIDLVELYIPVECLKLKSIYIDGSKLMKLDLRGTPNLKRLRVVECVDLVELYIPVEGLKLKSIYIDSSKLRTLDLRKAPNLETLSVGGCYNLVELRIHVECLKLESIDIMGAKLRTFDLGLTSNLIELSLTKCYSLVELHAPFGCLKKLADLDLSGCLRFKSFSFYKIYESNEVGSLSELHLIAESVDICALHSDNNLPKFRFSCSYYEHTVPSSIGNLEKLISIGLCACTDLDRFSRNICGLRCLRKLTLEGGIPEAPKDLGQLESLVELSFSTTKITHLPESIIVLKCLKVLKLKSCWLLEKLPEDLGQLECLEELFLSEFEKLPEEFGCLRRLQRLDIEGTGISHLPQSIFSLTGMGIIHKDLQQQKHFEQMQYLRSEVVKQFEAYGAQVTF